MVLKYNSTNIQCASITPRLLLFLIAVLAACFLAVSFYSESKMLRDRGKTNHPKFILQVLKSSSFSLPYSTSLSIETEYLDGYTQLWRVEGPDSSALEMNSCVLLGATMNLSVLLELFKPHIDKVTFVKVPDDEGIACTDQRLIPNCIIILNFVDAEACLSFSKMYSFTPLSSICSTGAEVAPEFFSKISDQMLDRGKSGCFSTSERISLEGNVYLAENFPALEDVIIVLPVHVVSSIEDFAPGLQMKELPLCTICLRRVHFRVTQIDGVDSYPITNRYFKKSSSCAVCELFWRFSSEGVAAAPFDTFNGFDHFGEAETLVRSFEYPRTKKLNRQCVDCSLRENLWCV